MAIPKKTGSAIIIAKIAGTRIFDKITINVINEEVEDLYEIVINPETDYVLQGKNQQFSVFLYKNGIKQNNNITFMNITENIPIEKYSIVVDDGNHFTVHNFGMFMDSPIKIKCICDSLFKEFEIKLRGLY